MSLDMDKDWWRQQKVYKVDNVWTVNGRPRETVQPSSLQKPTNLPGKTWLTLIVTQAPNAISPSHTHNGAAVVATVTKGRVLNQMIHPAGEHGPEHDSGPKIYEVGESWYEAPGCRHVRSENAGTDGSDAEFVANLIMDTEKLEGPGDFASKVVVIDAEVEEQSQGKS